MGGPATGAASLERLTMTPLIILAVTFALLWVLFILPQQRRVRAHQALVASVEPGDEVVLSAGIHGRIVELGAEDMTLEVAPGVVLRVARQAILRRIQDALGEDDPGAEPADTGLDEPDTSASDADGHAPSDPGTNV
jgi:preprotein translocase subunit YajC